MSAATEAAKAASDLAGFAAEALESALGGEAGAWPAVRRAAISAAKSAAATVQAAIGDGDQEWISWSLTDQAWRARQDAKKALAEIEPTPDGTHSEFYYLAQTLRAAESANEMIATVIDSLREE